MVRFGRPTTMWWRLCGLVLVVACAGVGGKWLTVYQKIAQEADLSEFHSLLQANKVAKASLYHRGVTVFAPTNEALAAFDGSLTQHLTSYHVIYGARTSGDFEETALESVQEDCPPIWVTRRDGHYYVNNALVLDYPKGFVSKNRQDVYGKTQVLYVIDEVLDPVVKNTTTTTGSTAYDFLSRTSLWTSAYTVGVFFTGLIHNRLENIFRSAGNYTFFLPVDGEYRVQFLDAYSIKAHVVPGRVLFTRPSVKFLQYETLTSGDYISVTVSLIQENDKYYVRGNTTLGDSNHQTGVIKSEIVLADIPMKNGVVHLISKPLTLYKKKLTKFPYLSVLDKFSADPMLNTSYVMGLNSGFNEYFSLARDKKFTFFVPRDVAWRRLRRTFDVQTIMNPSLYHLARQLLERHLVIGEVPISMETLEFATTKACVNLTTPAGKMCVSAERTADGLYVLAWNKKRIAVSRADYECSDGIVHVVDAPFMTDEDFGRFGRRTYVNFVHIWNALQKLLL